MDWSSLASALPITQSGFLMNSYYGREAFGREKELMNDMFTKDLEMWQRQNAYNTPKQQMKRLKAAGLNPALMYGKGTTGNANQMPGAKFNNLEPYYQATDLAATTAAGVQLSLANSQKQVLKSQALANIAKAGLDDANKNRFNQLLTHEIDNMKADTAAKQKVTQLNDYTLQHQKKTGTLKGDIIGNIAKVFNLNLDTNEGKIEARGLLKDLLMYKGLITIAPAVVNLLGGLLKDSLGVLGTRLFGKLRAGQSLDGKDLETALDAVFGKGKTKIKW